MGKRELVALLFLSSWCLVMVERLFLAVPLGCLRFVIVVFPDHTHLLFFTMNAYGSFTIKCTLGSCLCYSGCSILFVHKLQQKYFSFTQKSSLDPSKWYIACIYMFNCYKKPNDAKNNLFFHGML